MLHIISKLNVMYTQSEICKNSIANNIIIKINIANYYAEIFYIAILYLKLTNSTSESRLNMTLF